MKNQTKKRLMLLSLGFIFGFSILLNSNLIYYQRKVVGDLKNDNEPELKRAGYLNVLPFTINGNSGWETANSTYDWITGSGTWIDPYVIENISIDGDRIGDCIEILSSDVFFIINNSTFFNSGGGGSYPNYESGIKLSNAKNGILKNNNVSLNRGVGILLKSSQNITISGNIVNDNLIHGIFLSSSSTYNNVIGNNASNNQEAGIIIISSSNNNNISRNIVLNNNWAGFYSSYSNYNNIFENTINNKQGYYGLILSNSDQNNVYNNNLKNHSKGIMFWDFSSYNVISDNNITYTTNMGIEITDDSSFNIISDNNISYNENIGIDITEDSNFNNITSNIVSFSDNYGIYIHSPGYKNLFILNNFFNNSVNAQDSGDNTIWNNATHGNYWDDYGGVDADDDGIGDTPYNIAGSAGNQDNFPIWRDGDDIAPQIAINTPNSNDLTGNKSFTFDIKITDQTLNSTWYRLWNGTVLTNNNTFEYLLDNEIKQIIWNEVGNGTVTITFFANDSIGRISYKNVTVRKDIFNPIITINEPIENELFGIISPSAEYFNITFEDPSNIDYKWYMLSNETYNTYDHTWNGYIEQLFWGEIFNGTIKITIFANDSAGNIGFAEISVEKDIHVPEILIMYPVNNQVFGSNAPNFIVEIRDPHLATMWYTLNGGKNINFPANGTLDPTEWNTLIDGPVIITFYANNSLGNIHYESVDIIKETNSPIINIISPNIDQVYGYFAPNFNITIIDQTPINTTWYTIDNGVINYTFSGLTGLINQSAWEQKDNGVLTIIFYVNDSAGNLGFKDINVIKDTTAPKITINSPNPNQLCGSTAPSFSLTIVEPNPLEKRYSLNGRPNITFTAETQFSQSEWDNVGNGTVIIKFYIIDEASNINSSEVIVRKDIYAPEIIILSPIEDDLFENIVPSFTVDIQDANLDKMWYTINNGSQKVPFTSNDTIDQGLWDAIPDGIVTLTFFANDTIGNINFTSVNIIKDTLLPEILILSPNLNDILGINPPTFELSINESNLVSMWYTIDGGITNYTFTGTIGTIDQDAWNAALEGQITITFYAQDSAGNIGTETVIVIKRIPSQPSIPGYNIYLLFGIVFIGLIITLQKR